MAFGEMTFTQAKAIDLVWNTIAGRCLQAALAAIAYKVLTQALMLTSEREAIPYELFCVLSISAMSGKAFWKLLKATFSKFTIRTRVVVFWLLISTGYLLLFPTLIDAVSGYQATQLTLVSDTRLSEFECSVDDEEDETCQWLYAGSYSRYI
jgi:hypothetical protein